MLVEIHAMREKFLAAMDDDFNTGSAISVLFDSLRLLNRHIDGNMGSHRLRIRKAPPFKSLVKATSVIRELSGVLGLFGKPIHARPAFWGRVRWGELLDDCDPSC